MIRVSAPGRICLFGEHQDYLGLPVITAAIDRYIHIEGRPQGERVLEVALPDIGGEERIVLPQKGRRLPYRSSRDYLRGVCNVLAAEGLLPERGARCMVRGTIPINAGTSSSSALCVAWTRFLLNLGGTRADDARVAHLAWRAEVTEFGEPGGKMDQYASALGGVRYIAFKPRIETKALPRPPGKFILGDSGEPKDTMGILSRVRRGVEEAVAFLREKKPSFSLETTTPDEARALWDGLEEERRRLLTGALKNRDILRRALSLFNTAPLDGRELGRLLSLHHRVLAGELRISTPKIERLLRAATDAGAAGGKINGSGGGGCMFAYAPENAERVARAIEQAGGRAHILQIV